MKSPHGLPPSALRRKSSSSSVKSIEGARSIAPGFSLLSYDRLLPIVAVVVVSIIARATIVSVRAWVIARLVIVAIPRAVAVAIRMGRSDCARSERTRGETKREARADAAPARLGRCWRRDRGGADSGNGGENRKCLPHDLLLHISGHNAAVLR